MDLAELDRLTENQNFRELLHHLMLVLRSCSRGSMHMYASLMLMPQRLQVSIFNINQQKDYLSDINLL